MIYIFFRPTALKPDVKTASTIKGYNSHAHTHTHTGAHTYLWENGKRVLLNSPKSPPCAVHTPRVYNVYTYYDTVYV